ncbi:chloride channel protein [Hespellia stercorisuis]|uniref:H+/Cl-antiporter ClcA n=1 Tax=Hespellia stercorisuis DSM 15480 TaxID=1121950 RepID=A0A1M6HUP6_9FIRM|nr:chloride channel protein [Hespellia stercorisuis]SHJ25949.1 H+/Cl-antiporter ClcA [Hespellia stercorisuis DSM 15480]
MDWDNIKKQAKEQKKLFLTMIKWIVIATVAGAIIGVIASGFAQGIAWATELRGRYPMIILGLPLGGLLIVYMYHIAHQENNVGTNLMLMAVRTGEHIPLRVTPLILLSTIVTHLFGGSSGREGAALQFGGSIGNWFARILRLNESDKKIIILASMSAAFSALFGTPLAATIFPMEVVSIGVMYYAALVPCVFASFSAQYVALFLGIQTIQAPFPVKDVPLFYSLGSLKIILLGIICAFGGCLFCIVLRQSEHLYKQFFGNQYVRVVVGGLLVVGLTFAVGTQEYLGLGTDVIKSSFSGAAHPTAWVMKIVFTCLTLCAGYKGGEIVPSLFIGATLGSAASLLLGLPVDLCAACGMVGVFCAVTNSPITSLLIAFELFGFAGMPFYCAVVAISYMLSGYYSLYAEQIIVYSKTEQKFINRDTY